MNAAATSPEPTPVAPHIFTLTGNLLAERTLEFDSWETGRTVRARRETFQVGGKGINVSRMLTRLQIPNTALCFSGGAPGAECETWLKARGLRHRAFATTTATRTGTVVRDQSGRFGETTFLGPDAAPDARAIAACAAFLDEQADAQILVLAGSFPGWSSSDFDPLRQALDRWMTRGHLVADTYGAPLAWAAERPLALVKINADEVRALTKLDADRDTLPAAVKRWVITDGPGPIEVRDVKGEHTRLTPPTIRQVSPTGSGDVLLACMLNPLFGLGQTLAEAVQTAIPYASANAAHPGVAEFPLPLG
jgi:fructose-1-phosphate kinase PfkB-like protein